MTYFCFVNITWNNLKKQTYPDLVYVRYSVSHSEEALILTFYQLTEICWDEYCFSDHPSGFNKGDGDYEGISSISHNFNLGELSDIFRDLKVLNEASKLISRLKEKILLVKRTKIQGGIHIEN